MQELIDYLMLNCTINKNGELEFSLSKTIENWDLTGLFTVSNNTSNKEV